jgi:hypothetical protein
MSRWNLPNVGHKKIGALRHPGHPFYSPNLKSGKSTDNFVLCGVNTVTYSGITASLLAVFSKGTAGRASSGTRATSCSPGGYLVLMSPYLGNRALSQLADAVQIEGDVPGILGIVGIQDLTHIQARSPGWNHRMNS